MMIKHDVFRWHRRFAFLPKTINDETTVWLDWYEWRWVDPYINLTIEIRHGSANSVRFYGGTPW